MFSRSMPSASTFSTPRCTSVSPDMVTVNRINMDLFVPALVFVALAGKDVQLRLCRRQIVVRQALANDVQHARRIGCRIGRSANPQQDARFDLPAVGVQTIETIYRAGGKVLAIEANQTILVDREATLALANRYGLTVVALKREALSAAA